MSAMSTSNPRWHSERAVEKVLGLVLILGALNGCGTGEAARTARHLNFTTPLPGEAEQGRPVTCQFTVSQLAGNPYNPDEQGFDLKLTCPDGTEISQPAFFTVDYDIVLDHGREVARETGRNHWEVRWTPLQSGEYRWSIVSTSSEPGLLASGQLSCASADHRGFVRVSAMDPRYFEFTNGDFFYPLGHVIRSPSDARWLENDPRNRSAHESYLAQRTYAYETWFAEMEKNHENFCAIWMAPWWLGLEWSPAYPGYEGLGRYNQIHAAQLDRIIRSAEKHGIYLLLFAMNHGQLSSVTDAEWQGSPYRKANDGLVANPSDVFDDADCERMHRNRLRYMMARWGYSPALFAIALSSETDWFEPYDGRRCDQAEEVVEGISKPNYPVTTDPSIVDRWLRRMSDYIRQIDVHHHLVTTQFSKITSGHNIWKDREFDFALNNCYEGVYATVWSKVNPSESLGTAEALLGWSRMHDLKEKPKLVAEWGGSHQQNSHERLAAELHVGSWALAMTDCGGSTGFWWWDEIDNANLYSNYRGIDLFFRGHDRRGKNLTTTQPSVFAVLQSRDRTHEDLPELVPHPTKCAIMLSNSEEGFAYVYSSLMNHGYVSSDRIDDLHFDAADGLVLALPDHLRGGRYRLEFWDTFRGQAVARESVRIANAGAIPRNIRLSPFRSDLAVKLYREGD